MADIDTCRIRGIRAYCIVDANGQAFNGTSNLATIIARGMAPLCQVNSVGTEPNSGATAVQLASREIATFCQVNESGVDPVSSATALQVSQRGVRPMVAVDVTGIAQNGAKTILQLEAMGLECFCPVDENGTAFTLGGIVLSANSVAENTANATVVGTASIVVSFTGTPVWAITDPSGTFQINSSTGQYSVLSNTALNFEVNQSLPVTFSVTGTTPSIPNLVTSILITNVIETPVNTVLPAISGTAKVGQVLTVTDGTWTDMAGPGAHSFTYQWKRGGVDIGGATANTYTPVHADAGAVLTCAVTATNTAGNATATSAGTSAVTEAPSNTVAPVISGTAQEGQILTVTPGTWNGSPAPTLTYQWLRNGNPIGGATATNYTLVTADVGFNITCDETATNTAGIADAVSNTLGPVIPVGGTQSEPFPIIF